MWSTPPSLTTSYTVTIAGSFSRPAVRASRSSRSRKSRRSSGPRPVGEVQLLDRDVAPHHAVLGAPDDAHAAASELGEHDVATTDDPRRRHGSHGRSSLVTTPSACHQVHTVPGTGVSKLSSTQAPPAIWRNPLVTVVVATTVSPWFSFCTDGDAAVAPVRTLTSVADHGERARLALHHRGGFVEAAPVDDRQDREDQADDDDERPAAEVDAELAAPRLLEDEVAPLGQCHSPERCAATIVAPRSRGWEIACLREQVHEARRRRDEDHLHLHRRGAGAGDALVPADHRGVRRRGRRRRRAARHLARRAHPRQFPTLRGQRCPTRWPSSASWPRRPRPTSSSCRTSAPRSRSSRRRSRSCRTAGYDVPDYPEDPQTDDEKARARGVRRGEGQRGQPGAARGQLRPPRARVGEGSTRASHPHSMGAWSPDSKSHVATMSDGDFRSHREVGHARPADDALRIEHVAADGTVTVLKDGAAGARGRDRRRRGDAPRARSTRSSPSRSPTPRSRACCSRCT